MLTINEVLAMPRGEELDAHLARLLYPKLQVLYLRGIFGRGLYVVDTEAVRSGSGTKSYLLGGSWDKLYNDAGEVGEYYIRCLPPFSTALLHAWELWDYDVIPLSWQLYRLKDGGWIMLTDIQGHEQLGTLSMTVPELIAKAALIALIQRAVQEC